MIRVVGLLLAAVAVLPSPGLVVLPGAPAVVAASDSSGDTDWLQFPDASAISVSVPDGFIENSPLAITAINSFKDNPGLEVDARAWGWDEKGQVISAILFTMPGRATPTSLFNIFTIMNYVPDSECNRVSISNTTAALACISSSDIGIVAGAAFAEGRQIGWVIISTNGDPIDPVFVDEVLGSIVVTPSPVRASEPDEPAPNNPPVTPVEVTPEPVVGVAEPMAEPEPELLRIATPTTSETDWVALLGLGIIFAAALVLLVLQRRSKRVPEPHSVLAHVPPTGAVIHIESMAKVKVPESIEDVQLRWETEQQHEWDAAYYQEELLLVNYWKDKPSGIKNLGLEDRVKLTHEGDEAATREKLNEIIQAKDSEAVAVIKSRQPGALVALAKHRVCMDSGGCCTLYSAAECPECRLPIVSQLR